MSAQRFTPRPGIPTDGAPAIIAEAIQRRTRPEFIDREGFERCPRCARVWPDDHFRPDAQTSTRASRRYCLNCRRGRRAAEERAAIALGVCSAYGCEEPIADRAQCDRHSRMSTEGAERARAMSGFAV